MNIENILKKSEGKHNIKQNKIEEIYHFADEHLGNNVIHKKYSLLLRNLHIAYNLIDYYSEDNCIGIALLIGIKKKIPSRSILKLQLPKNCNKILSNIQKLENLFSRNNTLYPHREKQIESVLTILKQTPPSVVLWLMMREFLLSNIYILKDKEQKIQIAKESLDVHGLIARALGIIKLKNEINDNAFKILHPNEYKKTLAFSKKLQKEKSKIIQDFKKLLKEKDISKSITKITDIARGNYSLYKKMTSSSFYEDSLIKECKMRILVPNIESCYLTLGKVHQLGRVKESEFIDYIASPTEDGYRNLYTEVERKHGEVGKFYIRTPEMDRKIHLGIANRACKNYWKKCDLTFYPILNSIKHPRRTESINILQDIKNRILKKQIQVFSRTGKTIKLPYKSTVLDYAIFLNEEKASYIKKVIINNESSVKFNYPLKGDEFINIEYGKQPTIKTEWLHYCVTHKAKNHIIKHIKSINPERMITSGKEKLEEALKQQGKEKLRSIKKAHLQNTANYFHVPSFNDVLIRIAHNELKTEEVIEAIFSEWIQKSNSKNKGKTIQKISLSMIHEDNKNIIHEVKNIFNRLNIYFKLHYSKSAVNFLGHDYLAMCNIRECISRKRNKVLRTHFELHYSPNDIKINSITSPIKNIKGIKKIILEFPHERKQSLFAIIGLILIWALYPVVLDLSAKEGISNEISTAIRLWGGATFFIIYNFYQKYIKDISFKSYKYNWKFLALSLLIIFRIILSYESLTYTTPGEYVIVFFSSIVFLNLLLVAYQTKRKQAASLLSYILLGLGLLLLFIPLPFLSEPSVNTLGNAFAFGLFILTLIYTYTMYKYFEKSIFAVSALKIIGDMMIFSAFIFSLLITWNGIYQYNILYLLLLYLFGILICGIANVLYSKISKHYDYSSIFLITLFIILGTLISQSLYDPIKINVFISSIFVILAFLLSLFSNQKKT